LNGVLFNESDLSSFRTEDESITGNSEFGFGLEVRETDLGKTAGKNLAFAIIKFQFCEESAGFRTHGTGGANDFGVKNFARNFRNEDFGDLTCGDGGSQRLGDMDEYAESFGLSEAEEFFAGSSADEFTDFSAACCDDAGERSDDAGETLEFFKTTDVCARGLDGGSFESEVSALFGFFLFTDTGGFEEVSPTRCGGFGKVKSGLGLEQLSAGLGEFLIEFGSVNFGEELAGLDFGTDIDEPAFQVTVSTGVDGSFEERTNFGCEQNGGGGSRGSWPGNGDGWNGELFSFLAESGAVAPTRDETSGCSDDD
jgi:hypothetical protein